MISQRDIVEVSFPLYQGSYKHPAIVLSSNDAIQMEESFMAMMLTTDSHDDEFSFIIEDDMLLKPLNCDYCEARIQLVSFFRIDQIIKNSHFNNKIKPEFFEEIIKQMNLITFNIDPKKFGSK